VKERDNRYGERCHRHDNAHDHQAPALMRNRGLKCGSSDLVSAAAYRGLRVPSLQVPNDLVSTLVCEAVAHGAMSAAELHHEMGHLAVI
jgi:hypothetical protein